jgi:hypothetical protein
VEIGRRGSEDISAAASIVPGNPSDGFEQTVGDAADEAWSRLWPW